VLPSSAYDCPLLEVPVVALEPDWDDPLEEEPGVVADPLPVDGEVEAVPLEVEVEDPPLEEVEAPAAAPIRAPVSMKPAVEAELLDVLPDVPAVALAPPDCRHPVTVTVCRFWLLLDGVVACPLVLDCAATPAADATTTASAPIHIVCFILILHMNCHGDIFKFCSTRRSARLATHDVLVDPLPVGRCVDNERRREFERDCFARAFPTGVCSVGCLGIRGAYTSGRIH
jgi:hypothetical protein